MTPDRDLPGERALAILDDGGPWSEAVDTLLAARGGETALRDRERAVSGSALAREVARIEAAGDGTNRAIVIELANTVDALTGFLATAWQRPVTALVPPGLPGWERDRLLAALDSTEDITGGPGVVFATSGTTGAPKLVFQAWRSLLANAVSLARTGGFTTEDTMLVGTPLHHSYGFTVALLGALAGGSELLLGSLPLSPDAWAVGVAAGATLVQSVPAMYRWIATSPGGLQAGTGRLRMAVVAGEAVDPALGESWRVATPVPLVENYGTTETGPISLDLDQVAGSVGRPLPGVEVRVTAHERGDEERQEGELLVRAHPPASRYLSQDEGLTADGWFHTGDLGSIDVEGRIRLARRVDERVNIAGNKVDVVEVEVAVLDHPGVRECAVVARHHGDGPRLCAFVVVEGKVSTTELRRHLADRLAPHKIPSTFRTVWALPRTASGKLRRSELLD